MSETAPETLNRWRTDAVAFVREEFGAEPDAWQLQALREWSSPKPKQRIALRACAGPGKSSCLAWFGWHALLTHGDGVHHPNGFAAAITGENLKNNLWKELSLWRERSKSGILRQAFEMTTESIFERDHPQTWWLNARNFSKTADVEAQGRTLSGLHSRSVFALVDESGDVPPAVGRSAEQALANTECAFGRIAQAGNPTSLTGMLYQSTVNSSHLWTTISITGDPDDPDRSPRVDIDWAREQIALYGRDNPWVMAFILGKFPPGGLNQLLTVDEVDEAMKRHLTEDVYLFQQKRLGIDVARFGDDPTMIAKRQGRAAFGFVEMRGAPTDQIAARVMAEKGEFHSELDLIDGTGGYAGGVVDMCLLGGVHLMEVNFSGKADDPRFFNRRTEMHWRLAQWIKTGGALPKDDQLRRELLAPTYTFLDGKIRLEEKDQIKKRLSGMSPNKADALALTFGVQELPRGGVVPGWGLPAEGEHAATEWDPFTDRPPVDGRPKPEPRLFH